MLNDLLAKTVGEADGGRKAVQLVLQLHLVSSLKHPENETIQFIP